jgi:hypothetical protein
MQQESSCSFPKEFCENWKKMPTIGKKRLKIQNETVHDEHIVFKSFGGIQILSVYGG